MSGSSRMACLYVARDAVQHKEVDVGFELITLHAMMHVGAPELHGQIVGHELAFAGILHELLPQRRAGVERAKDIPTSEVMEARDGAQHLALCALATARGTHDEDGAETSKFLGISHKTVRLAHDGLVTNGSTQGVPAFSPGPGRRGPERRRRCMRHLAFAGAQVPGSLGPKNR